jgi:iron complex outermembrane receptor protein
MKKSHRTIADRTIVIQMGVALLATSLHATSLHAQEGGRFGELEEVTVTARRVEENMQTVPVSVSTFDGEEFTEIMGAQNLTDVSIAPNVDITNGAGFSGLTGAPTIFIRGLGQGDFLAVTDPAVGVYVDGVYIARSVGSLLELTDFERIEVLRGPQGTLYGRNTEGGAINLISSAPGEESAGKISIDAGGDGFLRFKGSVDVPINDNGAAARFTVYHKEIDGFVDVLQATDQDFADGLTLPVAPAGLYDDYKLGAQEVSGIAGKVIFASGDVFSADIGFDFTEDRSTHSPLSYQGWGLSVPATGITTFPAGVQATQINAANGCLPGVTNPGAAAAAINAGQQTDPSNPNCVSTRYSSPDFYSAYIGFQDRDGTWIRPENTVDTGGVSLTMNWDLDNFSVKSITAYREMESQFYHTFGGAPFMTYQNQNNNFDNEQISQEFQLNGDSEDGRLTWVAGLYFFQEEGNQSVNIWRPNSFPVQRGPNLVRQANSQDSRDIDNTSQAVFGQLTYGLSDEWDLTLGYRYSDNEKDYFYQLCNNTGTLVGLENCIDAPLERTGQMAIQESNVNVTLGWNVSENIYAYASFADGFRDGGFPARFNTRASNIPDPITYFSPEYVDTFEIGLKADWLDGRLRTNFAMFYSDYQNLQGGGAVPNLDPGIVGSSTVNKGDATMTGLEGEILWAVTDNLRIDWSFGTLDSEYDCINQYSGTSEIVGCTADGELGGWPVDINVSTPIQFAPEFNTNLGVSYSANLDSGAEILTRLDWRYTDEQWGQDGGDPSMMTPSYKVLNASATYFPSNANWNVGLSARNLTDEEYHVRNLIEVNSGAYGGVPARPRYVYLSFRYEF